MKLRLASINKKLRSRTYLVKTSFLKQLPFKFFNVHWDYVNCTVRRVFRKIIVYELNRFYFCPMYGKQLKICFGLLVCGLSEIGM